jgi:hypothetical protein
MMQDSSRTALAAPVEAPSAARLWAGRIASGLAIAFLGFDVAVKLVEHPAAVEGTVELDYAASAVLPIGLLGLVAALLWGGLYLLEPRLRALLPFRALSVDERKS